MPLPKLYGELASWFHLLTAPKDYAEEAEFYRKTLFEHCATAPKTLLELGSGGGNNASHMKRHFQMTLVDLSADMLELSRTINPECAHIEGDMRTVRLGREFDAVFIHDAVMYMTTEADLCATMETASLHCQPGGAAVFVPDYVRETFQPSTHCGGHDDERTGRGCATWSGRGTPSQPTHSTTWSSPSCCARKTARCASSRTGTPSASSTATCGSACCQTRASSRRSCR